MAQSRLVQPAHDKAEQALKAACGWLADAIGPKLFSEFARGASFFTRVHPETTIEAIARQLNLNREPIAKIADDMVGKFDYKENMRPTLLAYAATSAIIGSAYRIDPVALMAFVSKECPKDTKRLEREFRRMKGVFQLSPGNIAREYARDPKDNGVIYDMGLIRRHLADNGIQVDFHALRNSDFRDRAFLARNPFGNMLGATLTISLIMKREGYSVADAYVKTEPWRAIARRYNAAQYAKLYGDTYVENLKRLREGVSFSGWKPQMVISRLEDEKRKVYTRTKPD